MKRFLKLILKWLAKFTIIKYRPLVIGVTGSVGKTSTKEAIAAILGTKYQVGQTDKNFNNEIGLPLAIIRAKDSGYRNVFKWLQIIILAIYNIIITNKNYPPCLVLEMGVDHKGDMDYLLSVVKPKIGVLTAVSEVHLEYLDSLQNVVTEKVKLLKSLPCDGLAVFNGDQEQFKFLNGILKCRQLTFGFNSQSDVWADSLQLSQDEAGVVRGYSFKLHTGGSVTPLLLPKVLGQHQVSIALAVAAVGLGLGLTSVDIAATLRNFNFPNGRMKLLSGIKNTKLIDDTYNSSPLALTEALKTLADFPLKPGAKRWAILGDMLELGSDSEILHQQCGRELVKYSINRLVTIGERSRDIGRGALKEGLPNGQYVHFAKHNEAISFLREKIGLGDVVLLKGSQGARIEKIVKPLMSEPEKAKDWLVRQSKPWV